MTLNELEDKLHDLKECINLFESLYHGHMKMSVAVVFGNEIMFHVPRNREAVIGVLQTLRNDISYLCSELHVDCRLVRPTISVHCTRSRRKRLIVSVV